MVCFHPEKSIIFSFKKQTNIFPFYFNLVHTKNCLFFRTKPEEAFIVLFPGHGGTDATQPD